MPLSVTHRPRQEDLGADQRLNGWKEIATYLARGERTVKRWESDRGLPIHRIPGGGRAVVHAFKYELDQWLQSTKAAELDSSEPQDVAPPTDHLSRPHPPEDFPPAAAGESTTARLTRHAVRFAFTGVFLVVGWALLIAASLYFNRHRAAHASSAPVSEVEKELARDLYLQGRYEWNKRSPDSLTRALDDFTQCLVHDPGYAEAYVGLADTYDLLQQYTTMPEGEAFSRALVAAKKAVALNDSLSEGHRALAFAEMYGAWDFRSAENEFRRAIDLNPNDPVARRWYANAFAVRGRFEESLEQINKAQELDPTSHATLADKGVMLFDAGHTQEGLGILKEVERTEPGFRSPHLYMARISFETGDYLTYLEEGRKTAELSNDAVLKDVIDAAQRGYLRGGEHGLLENVYAKQKQYVQSGKLWATSLADTCIHMGRKKEAVQLLELAYARHEEYAIISMLSDPDYIALKDESGYQALVQKINFPMPR